MSKHQLAIDNSQVPEGYKKTEVGVIPVDWEVIDVGELNHYITSGSRNWACYYSTSGSPFIRITNLTRESIYLDILDLKYVNLADNVSEGKRTELKNGDILISITADIGIVGYVNEAVQKPAYINQHISLVRFNIDDVEPKFVAYFLASENVQRLFRGSTDQGAKAGLNLDAIRKLKFAFPHLKEQRAIAQTLSDVDGLIAALDKLIAKKRNIKTATMQELLTGKKRLPGFGEGKGYKNTEVGVIPEDWDVASLVDVSINGGLVRGPFGGALKKEFFVKSGYKVYEQRNAIYRSIEIGNYFIDSKKFNDLRRFEISEGDLIVSCSGTIGCIYKIPEGAPQGVINQALLKITLNNNLIDSNLFLAVFCCDKFQEKITENSHGGAMQNLVVMDTFKNTLLQLPSFLEQKAIATILSDMDAEIAALEKRRAKTQAMKQGMMQELLTGKTRLIDPNNP